MTPIAGQALRALTRESRPIAASEGHVPSVPGLYAIYGGADVWHELGLREPPDDRPLYVGKSESSLLGRDLGQHFGDGRAGSSTVRCSFAALLRDTLDLKALPRNPAKPERFANYGCLPKTTGSSRSGCAIGCGSPSGHHRPTLSSGLSRRRFCSNCSHRST